MMNTVKQQPALSQTLIALAVLAAFGPARAQDIGELTAPGNSISIGAGVVSGNDKDRARFGLYNGLRNHSVNGLLGFEYLNRDDATGTWTKAEGRNLGLDSREFSFSREKQGDWKFNAGFSEIVLQNQRTINTGMTGAGSTTPTVVRLATPGTGSDLDLDLKRKGISLGGEKWFLGNALQFQVNFKNEDKDGARLFGKGFSCASAAAPGCGATTATAAGWALLMLPEPVNSNIKQVEAKLNYNTEKLLLSGGYYGSFYTNSNGSLTPTVPGVLNNPLGAPLPLSAGLQGILGLPIALPPNNQAHQLYLSGNYRFMPTTHATFKYSYTHGTQDESFPAAFASAAPPGRSNLGGEVDTSLYQVGLTARPMPKLSLLANVRYEDKKDKTPIDLYNIEGTNTFTNGRNSHQRLTAKLEGSYQLPYSFRATVGADYESMDRGLPTGTTEIAGITALRQQTDEKGYRLELRRAMSETLTGAVGYSSARRSGSAFTALTPGFPIVDAGTLVATSSATSIVVPAMLQDRTRDKWKLSANWAPAERLSMQFWVEGGIDHYSGPTPRGTATVAQPTKGLRDTDMRLYSVDATYAMSDAWKLIAYYSRSEQMLHVNHSTGYMAALKNENDSIGLGITGKPSGRLQVGADLSFINDKNIYDQTMSPGASAANVAFLAANPLPNVEFNQFRLKLFGQYAVRKNAYVRLDFVQQHSRLDEWTWGYNGVPFVFSDNTTVTSKRNQNVSFVGVSYIYKFQ